MLFTWKHKVQIPVVPEGTRRAGSTEGAICSQILARDPGPEKFRWHLSWDFMCSKGMGLGTAQVLSRRGQMLVWSMFRRELSKLQEQDIWAGLHSCVERVWVSGLRKCSPDAAKCSFEAYFKGGCPNFKNKTFMCSKGMGLGTAQVLSRRGQMSVGSMFRLRYLDERHGLTLDIGGPRFWTTNGSFSRLGIFFLPRDSKKMGILRKKCSSGLNATRPRNASKRGQKLVAIAFSKCDPQILLL